MPESVLTHKTVHTGTHIPRIVTIPKDVRIAILGGSSHQAWVECVREGKTKPGSAMKVPNSVHKARTREIAQAAYHEWVIKAVGA